MSKTTPALRVLHTSDWHLGRMLFDQKRYPEFEKFLDWLAETIEKEHVSALLVAGDIFDTGTPSNRALELYYCFLARIARLPLCRHIIIIGGNHDSPSLLDAPNTVLHALNVHVRGGMSENPEDEVLLLKDANGSPELVVCAVPFLRDRDVRTSELGESMEDKMRNLHEGIQAHYAKVAALARNVRAANGGDIPVVAMGHLFTGGGTCQDDDGERSLYIGATFQVNANIFSPDFDYVALGHIHSRYRINNSETVRYCGAPLPMGFEKKKMQKSVCLVEFQGREAHVTELLVPTFQKLESIKGDRDTILARLKDLKESKSDAWLEIVYNGSGVMGNLATQIVAMLEGSKLRMLRMVNASSAMTGMTQEQEGESLADLTENDVFLRLLDSGNHTYTEDEREELLAMFREIAIAVEQEDSRAE